jgi:proline dehydrogenase
MSIMRSVLLAGSQSAWLRDHAVRYPFVRRSVSRFMPGETLDDALRATAEQQQQGVGAILTELGENLTKMEEADAVVRHYEGAFDRIAAGKLPAQISVKLTQLGLDLDKQRSFENLMTLVRKAETTGNFLWIDMEYAHYVDVTLEHFRRAREKSDKVGVAIQSCMRRTPADVDALLPLAPAIRLVKGAYANPPEVAFPRKADVDEAFYEISTRILTHETVSRGTLLHVATHDPSLVARIRTFVAKQKVPQAAYEFALLYGIQRGLQQRLVAEKERLRVLISYGEFWFPWYMRRLAERPANVWFVLKNLAG